MLLRGKPLCTNSIFEFFLEVSPAIQSLLNGFFIPPVAGLIKNPAVQFFRQIILGDIGVLVIMGVLIPFAVAQSFHQPGGGISNVKRDGEGAGIFDYFFDLAC